jgi:hypothetical protein
VLIGFGGAGIIVMAFSVLTLLFSQQERPKAVGVIAGVTFVSCLPAKPPNRQLWAPGSPPRPAWGPSPAGAP